MTTSMASKIHFSILQTKPKLKNELISMLKNMWAVTQGLSTPIIQPIIQGVFESKTLELLKDSTKRRAFKVTLKWIQDFIKTHLNWSYRAITIAAGKLHQTWEQEGMAMAHRVTCLVKVYNIPMCLVINTNQTKVHLVPTKGNQTWETRGAKHVQVLGIENKRQITTIISSLAKNVIVTFASCVSRDNKSYIRNHESWKKAMFFNRFPSYL